MCRIVSKQLEKKMSKIGRVNWFKLDKKFGFVELADGGGDAFLHVSVLKAAGYVSVPAGTSLEVSLETQQNRRRVVEVIAVDTTTALPDQPAAVRTKAARQER
jgi:CspA family cold shock protein